MSYEFTKLGAVEALTEMPENANALVEVDGAIKRVPASALSGGNNGPSEVVILPETEITKTEPGMFASVGLTELPAYPEVGMLYDVTMNGEAHTFPAIAAASMGMESMGDVLLFDQALPYGVIIAFSEKAEQTGVAVTVMNVDESWNPDTCVLSIKGKAKTASAGGGVCIVNVSCETADMQTFTNVTKDKTYAELKASYDAGSLLWCRLRANVSGQSMTAECPLFGSTDSELSFWPLGYFQTELGVIVKINNADVCDVFVD